MSLFQKKKKSLPIPEPFTATDIRVESSICTGETVIGFYDRSERKLKYSELVRDERDIAAFYHRYGLELREEKP